MFHGCVLKRGLISPVLAEMPNSKFSENLSEAASGFFFSTLPSLLCVLGVSNPKR